MTIIDFLPRQLAARDAENIKRTRMFVEGDNVVNDPLHGTMKAVKDIVGFVQR
jgi:hypothetical protein